jgi:alkylation response protein AidB-like acyl-CoA dehydrogenase
MTSSDYEHLTHAALHTSDLAWLRELEAIATGIVARTAVEADEAANFPRASFAALHGASALAMCIPESFGGLGLGPYAARPRPLPVWLAFRTLAAVDSSVAHCLQVHTSACLAADRYATPEYKERLFAAVIAEGAVLGAWVSGHAPVGTTAGLVARPSEGGFRVRGALSYATNAGVARYALTLAAMEGTGERVGLIIDLAQEGVHIDPSFWARASAMRATVSHRVCFEDVAVPPEARLMIGSPADLARLPVGSYPQFAANFLGTATGVLRLCAPARAADPSHLAAVVDARVRLEATEAMLAATAARYALGDLDRALAAGTWLYAAAEAATAHVIETMICSVGSSCLMRPSPLERMVRDFQFYRRNVKIEPYLGLLAKQELADSRANEKPKGETMPHEQLLESRK